MYTQTTTTTFSPEATPAPLIPSTPSSSTSTPSTPVSSRISPQSEYMIKLLSGNEIVRCITTNSKMSVKVVKQPSPADSYDFPDLRFHVLHHNGYQVGVIEAVKLQNNSVTYQLLHLVPESDFDTPKYYSNISLFTDLSKKLGNAYYSLQNKDKVVIKPNTINSNKKKLVVSSPLASQSFSPKPPDELDELLKLREEINILSNGNCSVYTIINQLYPQTYGGYRLSADKKTSRETYKTISKDVNVQVKEIRNVAVLKLYENNPVDFGSMTMERMDLLIWRMKNF
jgi:hypothetical protein